MDEDIFEAIQAERDRQDVKWGANRHLTRGTWLTILMEEVGEAAKASLEGDPSGYTEELIQVAAVAVAALESHRAGPPSLPLQETGEEACSACEAIHHLHIEEEEKR